MPQACRICDNSQANTAYIAREMMFGYRDQFEYFQCSQCGCLQISQIPANLDKYYPQDYYSLAKPAAPKPHRFKHFLQRERTRHCLGSGSVLGRVMARVFGPPHLPAWLKHAGIRPDWEILDVGCGAGSLLLFLRCLGFDRLTGVDPYVAENLEYGGVRIFKGELASVQGKFDVVMMHHSFEHMAEPLEALRDAVRIVSDRGVVLIRIPTVSSFAWRKYRTNWGAVEAPRHFYLHSIESIQFLAHQAGLQVERIDFDSHADQFWRSEEYMLDIPLCDERSYGRNPRMSAFSSADIDGFARKAEELNRDRMGDQACFHLRKLPHTENHVA
jgi:2-polyprenyl-3-methyl-5-hydroxy-6-metoxy-1,4-benzoquinol methylase